MKHFLKKLKKKWNRYLERLAESNKKQYGRGRLNCCDLNKQKLNKENKNQEI